MKNMMKALKVLSLFLFCSTITISCSKDEVLTDDSRDQTLKKASTINSYIVEPNGVDDTDNLKDAFNNAIAEGDGAVIELTEGTYYINFIEVREFYGKFKGAGRDKTTITNTYNYTPYPYIKQNLDPVLLRFVGGDVHMSHMTMKYNIDVANPKWLASLTGFSSLTSQYVSKKKHIKATIDNVDFIGRIPKCSFGLKASSGFNKTIEEGIPLSNIDISVTNCSFSDFNTHGATFAQIKKGNIVVGTKNNGNTFHNNTRGGIALMYNTSVKVMVEGNNFSVPPSGSAWERWGVILNTGPYPGYLQQEPALFSSIYNISHNKFNVSGYGGLLVIDMRRLYFNNEKPMLLQLKNNTFRMNEGSFTGINTRITKGTVIRNNKFEGISFFGVNIWGYKNESGNITLNENGLMLGNNLNKLSCKYATVYLNEFTSKWSIVGGNHKESLVNEGTDNIITGMNVNTSDTPLGPTIVDNLQEMKNAFKKAEE